MKKLIFSILFMFSTSLFAGSPGPSGWGKMTEVYVTADGSIVRIRFDQPINQYNCGAGVFYVRELDSPNSDRFLSTLLSAFAAGREVNFWIDSCTSSAWWGNTRPQPHDIYVR